MHNDFWWDTDNNSSFVNSILKFSGETRIFYLKTVLKIRLKHFIVHQTDFDDVINLWNSLQDIKNDFGEEIGSLIIHEAMKEIHDEFDEPVWMLEVLEKIKQSRICLNNDFIYMN